MAAEEIKVPVKAWLKPAVYRRLSATAETHQVTIADLVAECVRRQLAGAQPIDAAKVVDEVLVLSPSTQPSRAASAGRGAKWAVRRPWVAIAPDTTIHGPFSGQLGAMEFVRSQLVPDASGVEVRMPRRKRIEWTADMDALIRQRHGEGVADIRIAHELGEKQPAVSARRKSLGLPALFRSPNPRSTV